MSFTEDRCEGNIGRYLKHIIQDQKYTGCNVTPIFIKPQDREVFLDKINNKSVKQINEIIKANLNNVNSEFYKKQYTKIKRSKKETLIAFNKELEELIEGIIEINI